MMEIVFSESRTNEHGVIEYRWARGFVPECCLQCEHLDAEFGEFGSVLAGPWCDRNVWFPSRKGTCARRTPLRGFRRIPS